MQKKSLFILSFFFIVMLILNMWMPLYRDDYLAGIIWKTPHRLESMEDVLLSLILYYEFHGGRLVSFFFQFVAMLYDKVYFNVLNALAFPVMMALIVMHAKRCVNVLKYPALIFAAGAFMWLGLSHFGEVVIWLCGSAVYLWTGILAALFLLPYNLALKGDFIKYNVFLSSIMFFLGLIGACSVENLTITTSMIAVGACFWLFKKGALKCHLVMGAIGSCLGTLICIFAPGNFQRIIDDEDRGMIFHVLNQIPANLEMLLYLFPVILLLVLSYRLLKVDLAKKRKLIDKNPKTVTIIKNKHYILLGFIITTLVSYLTNGFFQDAIYNAIVAAVLSPIGLTDDTTISHFQNTMAGVDEALLYILTVSYLYLKGAEALHVTKKEICYTKPITLKDILSNYPETRYAAFLFIISVFNNMVVLGAPSFPGRALFSSSCIFIMGAIVILSIKTVYKSVFEGALARLLRVGGVITVIFLQVATIIVMYDIHKEDTTRVKMIAAQAVEGKRTAYVPRSKIPEQRRVLRHIAYDDFDTGMTRDHICRYYNIRWVKFND